MTIPRFAKNQHMNNKDKAEKLLEDYNDVFADIVNTLLFDGVNVIKEDSLEDIIEKITTKNGSEVTTMTGGPLSQLYHKGVREGREEGREEGVNETLLKVYINCRKKGMSIEESGDIVHFADRESLEKAEKEFQRLGLDS